jgi:hypothetical protein
VPRGGAAHPRKQAARYFGQVASIAFMA